ncbi:MAG: radical SAM protein [Mycoplasmatota bacterium]
MNKVKKYGEILMIWPCNLNCYYCLKNEIKDKNEDSYVNTHFLKWKNFEKFINTLKEQDIDTIYLSSINTEPMLYKYLKELILYLKNQKLKVGIRTNGVLLSQEKNINILRLLDEKISISLQGIHYDTFVNITGTNLFFDVEKLLIKLREKNLKVRFTFVVNVENYRELDSLIQLLEKYSENIKYLQIRKIYKYYEANQKDFCDDMNKYFDVKELLEKKYKKIEGFYESVGVQTSKKLKIYFWDDVFKKESVQSLNYFVDGTISDNTLLLQCYNEERKKENF